jgi:hypothetical protein
MHHRKYSEITNHEQDSSVSSDVSFGHAGTSRDHGRGLSLKIHARMITARITPIALARIGSVLMFFFPRDRVQPVCIPTGIKRGSKTAECCKQTLGSGKDKLIVAIVAHIAHHHVLIRLRRVAFRIHAACPGRARFGPCRGVGVYPLA